MVSSTNVKFKGTLYSESVVRLVGLKMLHLNGHSFADANVIKFQLVQHNEQNYRNSKSDSKREKRKEREREKIRKTCCFLFPGNVTSATQANQVLFLLGVLFNDALDVPG